MSDEDLERRIFKNSTSAYAKIGGTLVAGAMGFGATTDWDDAVTAANITNNVFDKGIDGISGRMADKEMYRKHSKQAIAYEAKANAPGATSAERAENLKMANENRKAAEKYEQATKSLIKNMTKTTTNFQKGMVNATKGVAKELTGFNKVRPMPPQNPNINNISNI